MSDGLLQDPGVTNDGATDTRSPATLKSSTAPVRKERRQRSRRAYPYHQLVAPVVGGELPKPREFTRVCCRDIAAGGFSYLASEPPPSETVIVAFGKPPRLVHLAAQVVHVTRIKRKGKYTYLVGCSYTGRALYSKP